MEELKLQAGEYVVYEHSESMYFEKKGGYSFFVTNKNIILKKMHARFFQKPLCEVLKFPIDEIRCIDGAPQIAVEENEDAETWDIVVLFQDDTCGLKRFSFEYDNKKKDKVKVDKIAENIMQLSSSGTIILKKGEKKKENVMPAIKEKVEVVAEKVSNGFKGLFNMFKGKKK